MQYFPARAARTPVWPASSISRNDLPPEERSRRQAQVPADGSTTRKKCSSNGSKEAGEGMSMATGCGVSTAPEGDENAIGTALEPPTWTGGLRSGVLSGG